MAVAQFSVLSAVMMICGVCALAAGFVKVQRMKLTLRGAHLNVTDVDQGSQRVGGCVPSMVPALPCSSRLTPAPLTLSINSKTNTFRILEIRLGVFQCPRSFRTILTVHYEKQRPKQLFGSAPLRGIEMQYQLRAV
jgi:hypothetical protein